MVIVDVETTGTDPRVHSLLSIGAVDFETGEEFFEECQAFPGAKVEEEATAVNGVGKKEAFDTNKQTDKELVVHFLEWLSKSGDHTIAGQNPHFDTSFIVATAERYHLNYSIPKRVIDLHSITWAHMIWKGGKPPIDSKRSDLNSDKIMEYVGIPAEAHPHIAIGGAKIEAEAFSRLFREKPFYAEVYASYPIPWLK